MRLSPHEFELLVNGTYDAKTIELADALLDEMKDLTDHLESEMLDAAARHDWPSVVRYSWLLGPLNAVAIQMEMEVDHRREEE